jgi:hypothetical protein
MRKDGVVSGWAKHMRNTAHGKRGHNKRVRRLAQAHIEEFENDQWDGEEWPCCVCANYMPHCDYCRHLASFGISLRDLIAIHKRLRPRDFEYHGKILLGQAEPGRRSYWWP